MHDHYKAYPRVGTPVESLSHAIKDSNLVQNRVVTASTLSSNFNKHFSNITQIGLEHGTHLAAERSKRLMEDKNVNAISWDILEYCL